MAIEDFTTYTEVDPNSRISVTSSTITATALPRNEDSYVYDDKGVAHFDGDFEHLITTKTTNVLSVSVCGSWVLTNTVDDLFGLITANESFLILQHNSGSSYLLREFISGTAYTDSATLTGGQTYYLTINRDESIGSFGQLTCLIYSDSGRTILVDTLTLSLHAKLDLRYVFGLMTFNDGNTSTGNFVFSDLDLGEAVGGIVFPSIRVPIPSLAPLAVPSTIPGGNSDNTWITN
jgi:hypothetical protein